MKKEANGKKAKWLWLAAGIVVLLAVVGVVLALVFGGQEETKAGGPAELYWNVDRAENVSPETGLSTRKPAQDGKYYVRFAHDGELVEYPVSDKKLVNYIDSMDVMGLELDKDRTVVNVYNVDDVASVIGESVYVQNITGDTIIANSAITMNGKKVTIKLNEELKVYDVTGKGEFVGKTIQASDLKLMDTISVFGTLVAEDSEEKPVPTHIFVTKQPVESAVYWRANQFYDSTNKVTTRKPNENGEYVIPFYSNGETVELKTKDKAIVTEVDAYSAYWCHFGFEFDKDGYIVGMVDSFLGSRTLLQCQRFDITEYMDGSYTATNLIQNNGAFVQGTIDPDCPIYDVSNAAIAEGQVNRKVDSLMVGDRVCIWTDISGKAVLVYVANRMVDVPVFFNVSRKYDTTTQSSTRVLGSNGYYEVTLLKAGDTENKVYYIKDKEALNRLDSTLDRCVGMKVGEGNIVEYVYDMECVFGNTNFCRGWYVVGATGSVCSFMASSGSGYTMTGVLAADCKAWNVSTTGKYGEEVTLQYGDYVLAGKTPTGEVSHAYVLRRYLGEDTMHWNLTRMWDDTKKASTRVPNADGWYVFTLSHKGKEVTAKTNDAKLVKAIDESSVPALSIVIENGIIKDVNDGAYATGGTKYAAYTITKVTAEEVTMKTSAGAEKTFKLTENTVAYNVSVSFESYLGEKTDLRVGDFVNCFTDINAAASIVYVRGREVNKMAWPADRQYDSANACTARKPDANGWYYIKLAIDGTVKTYKTKNKTIVSSIDAYTSLFGVQVNGDVIVSYAPYNYVKNVKTVGITDYTVSSVSGNKVTAIYTLGSKDKTGTTETITLPANCSVYDVSPTAAKFGASVKLQVGDTIRTYVSDDNEHIYVYVTSHCTRAGGYKGYCDHCKKAVYWNAYTTASTLAKYDTHYYLPADTKVPSQLGVYTNDRNFEMVLDLNGHVLYRENGRAALVRYGDTLTIMDTVGGGEFRSVNSDTNGGVIMVLGGTLNLHSGTLTSVDCKSSMGGVVYATDKSVVNIYGGTIKDGIAQGTKANPGYGGNIYVASGSKLNMLGGTVSGGTAVNGVYEDDAGAKKTRYASGGNIYVGLDAVANITGGTIENGVSPTSAGNIYAANNAVVNIGGNAVIKDGKANSDGGNILLAGEKEKYPTLNLNGGTITGGVVTKGNGANILVREGGNVNIAGGTVSGDFVLGKNVALSISGAPKIANGTTCGLEIPEGVLATLGTMSDGAEIYINAEGVFTKPCDNANSYQSYFKLANSVLKLEVENNALKVVRPAESDPDYCPHCGKKVTWTGINALTTESGHYRLTENISRNSMFTISSGKDVVIDLAGKSILVNAKARAFFISGGTLSIKDSVGGGVVDGGDVTGATGKDGGTININATGTFNLYSGTVQGGTGRRGGNIYSTGTVNIYGGFVVDGVATGTGAMGANVCIYSGGKLNVYGGTITQTGTKTGNLTNGNITNYSGTVNVYGGEISDTRAEAKGIQASSGTFNVYGGTITSSIGWHTTVGVKIYNGVISGQDPTVLKADCATVTTDGTRYVVTQTTLDANGACASCNHTYSATTECGTCGVNHVPAA